MAGGRASSSPETSSSSVVNPTGRPFGKVGERGGGRGMGEGGGGVGHAQAGEGSHVTHRDVRKWKAEMQMQMLMGGGVSWRHGHVGNA